MIKNFDDFLKEATGDNANFPTAYVNPDLKSNLKPDSIGYERAFKMMEALFTTKRMSQKELAIIHDEGERSGMGGSTKPGEKSSRNYVVAFSYMVNNGWVSFEKESNRVYYFLTPKGEELLHSKRGSIHGKKFGI